MTQYKKVVEALSRFRKDVGGVPRWDYLLKHVPSAGFVPAPATILGHSVDTPFYYVYEGFGDQEQIIIRKKAGGYYRLGSCFGFYGMSTLILGRDITLCEGLVDYCVLSKMGYNVLACLTSGVSQYQRYLLSHLTKRLNLAFDTDVAGNKSLGLEREFEVRLLKSPLKDFGAIIEDTFLKQTYLGVDCVNSEI